MNHQILKPPRAVAAALLLLGMVTAGAQEGPNNEPLASISGGTPVSWVPKGGLNFEGAVLKVSGPNGFFEESEFGKGQTPFFVPPGDGSFVYELYLVPPGVSRPGGRPQAGSARIDTNGRDINDSVRFTPLNSKRGPVQSGAFTVLGGLRVDSTAVEK